MLDNEDYIEITKAYLDNEINDIAFYMMMFKGFDGFTCTTSPCKVCGDRIIPTNNQTSTSYCEICLVQGI